MSRLLSGLTLAAIANLTPASSTSPCDDKVPAGAVRIHDIQGAAHLSPMNGAAVSRVPGIVTARRGSGFFMEDWLPDADPATSEGIFVFTSTAPTVNVGDCVQVSGTVSEFRPGGSAGANNLSTTNITAPTIVPGDCAQSTLPPPVVVGSGGRIPPRQRIAGSVSGGNVETSGSFAPASDGIDFYESLEGMRVVVNEALATGPTNPFGEIPVVADNGANAAPRSARGGVLLRADTFHPERMLLAESLIGAGAMPRVKVGDRFAQVAGIVDYSFGNFKLLLTRVPVAQPGTLVRETTALRGDSGRLTVASFNVENLDPSDGPRKFSGLAAQIVRHLRSPDIVALIEVQDSNGAIDNGIVDASATLSALTAAIRAAGGPTYAYRQIDPVNDQDGGEPGGNIRQVFLFNAARVGFVDRPGGSATAAVAVVNGDRGPRLSLSPGRIAPNDAAFTTSRKPLAGEFVFGGQRLFLIANHFNSKGGDQPLFGRFQPPALASETQRNAQATIVAGFVSSLLSADPDAAVIVLGDLNDFEFSRPLRILESAGLVDLVEQLPADERYTYVFEGNSQVLDHILVSPGLAACAFPEYDVVHLNAEFADQHSDHDPEVARFTLPRRQAVGTTLTDTSISCVPPPRITPRKGTTSAKSAPQASVM